MGRTYRQRLKKQKNRNETNEESPNRNHLINKFHQEMLRNGWTNSTNLCIRSYPQTGRGVSSTIRTFQKDDLLIQIPIKAMITIETLDQDTQFKELFDFDILNENNNLKTSDQKDDLISFQMLLAIYVLYQKHLEANSKFYYYTQMLPASFTTPFFLKTSELYNIPECMLLEIVEENRKIKEQHRFTLSMLRSKICACCGRDFEKDVFALADVKWAYYVVNTRSVHIESKFIMQARDSELKKLIKGSTNAALAPFLDLFNHSHHVQTKAELFFNKQTAEWDYTLKLLNINETIDGKTKPYSEIFINYNNLSNRKLLMEYGFITPDNPNDFHEINLLDIETFLKKEKNLLNLNVDRKKFKFIREHNLCEAMFLHPVDGISHNLHIVFHLIFKEESYFPNVLNRIAFGDANNLADVSYEIRLFINHLIKQYESYYDSMQVQIHKSGSALVFLDYLQETLKLLNNFHSQL